MVDTQDITDAVEDYLKAIHKLQEEQGSASTSELANLLDVSPASVSGMIKKLVEMNLVTHKPYEGAELTDHGFKIAMEVLRHHRLIERFLAEALDISWDRVHEEAEKLEHVISEDLENRMDDFLGNPKQDPHGSPIPSRDGKIEKPPCKSMSGMEPGERAVIYEVSDHDSSLLKFLAEKDLFPGTKIEFISSRPHSGGVRIKAGDRKVTLSEKAANQIQVTEPS